MNGAGTHPDRGAVEVYRDAAALATAVADRFALAASGAISSHGKFVVALSGGSTPRAFHAAIAAPAVAGYVDWQRVHCVWGDERCVPPDDLASNYRMARETLLDHVPVPPANVHRIHGEDDPARAAEAYERVLRALSHVAGSPIDLVLLGLGDDGHTASLFPGGAELGERVKWTVATLSPVEPRHRVSLSPACIGAAAEVVFVVAGASKAAIVRRVLREPPAPVSLPAQLIAESSRNVRWMLDRAAAAGVSDFVAP